MKLFAILIIALVATAGSLYFSEVVGYFPCKLCWYQRILMYPIVMLTLVGLISRANNTEFFLIPMTLLGFCIAFYHYLMQWGLIPSETCGDSGCSIRNIDYLGFITIPFLSLIAFTMINTLLLIGFIPRKRKKIFHKRG